MDELAGTAHKVEKEGKEGVVEGRDSLGILYGMAENEALGEVCNVLEEVSASLSDTTDCSSWLRLVLCLGRGLLWVDHVRVGRRGVALEGNRGFFMSLGFLGIKTVSTSQPDVFLITLAFVATISSR